MKLTKFESLREVIKDLGIPQAINQLLEKLNEGQIDAQPQEMVFGKEGIYYLDENNLLVNTIVHICDYKVNPRYTRNTMQLFEEGKFGNPKVIKKIHKYHLVHCEVLQSSEKEGWKQKFKVSRRKDGNFFYRFLFKDGKVHSREKQILLPCKKCLNLINKSTGKDFKTENFRPSDFFVEEATNDLTVDQTDFSIDLGVPNTYRKDWPEISKKYREKKNYQCENPTCPAPDLSDSSLRKYLHTHHRNMSKADNRVSNLQALCIFCHAEQPNHAHIKQTEDYKKYLNYLDSTK